MSNTYNEMLEVATKRRTTKLYDNTKKIDEGTIKKIYEFAQRAPHSMGLELVRHLTFGPDSDHKDNISKLLIGFNQIKGDNCSHIGLTITKKEEFFTTDNKELRSAVTRVAQYGADWNGVEIDPEILESTIKTVASKVFGQNNNNGEEWMAKQGYIHLGFIILAAESLDVNTTIMEGYEYPQMNQYLLDHGLINKDERVSMTICFGKADSSQKGTHVGAKQLRRNLEDYWKAA